jgi:hypothetical protein
MVPREKAGRKRRKTMYLNHVSIIGFVGNDARLKSTMHGAAQGIAANPMELYVKFIMSSFLRNIIPSNM